MIPNWVMSDEWSKGRRPASPPQPAGSRPAASATVAKPAGKVRFDARGNAVWEWALKTGEFVRDSATARLRKLDNPTLSLEDETPTSHTRAQPNPQGTIKGYNPYDSGRLSGKDVPKKKDLKKLGDWLALKRQAARNKDKAD